MPDPRPDQLAFRVKRSLLRSQKHQNKTKRRGNGLNEENLLVRRQAAVDPSDEDAKQEEDFDGEPCLAKGKAPEQPRRQETVVKALVCRQRLRLRCGIGAQTKGLSPQRLVPKEHLQGKDVDVQGCDKKYNDIGDGKHSVLLR